MEIVGSKEAVELVDISFSLVLLFHKKPLRLKSVEKLTVLDDVVFEDDDDEDSVISIAVAVETMEKE